MFCVLLFCAFLLSSPRSIRVVQREKPLFFFINFGNPSSLGNFFSIVPSPISVSVCLRILGTAKLRLLGLGFFSSQKLISEVNFCKNWLREVYFNPSSLCGHTDTEMGDGKIAQHGLRNPKIVIIDFRSFWTQKKDGSDCSNCKKQTFPTPDRYHHHQKRERRGKKGASGSFFWFPSSHPVSPFFLPPFFPFFPSFPFFIAFFPPIFPSLATRTHCHVCSYGHLSQHLRAHCQSSPSCAASKHICMTKCICISRESNPSSPIFLPSFPRFPPSPLFIAPFLPPFVPPSFAPSFPSSPLFPTPCSPCSPPCSPLLSPLFDPSFPLLSLFSPPLPPFHFPFFPLESPLVYPYPKNTLNSDHGLSFPSPETQTMVWVSPFPCKYRVWGGLGFGPSFSQTMVWVSSCDVTSTGVGVDEWALTPSLPPFFPQIGAFAGPTRTNSSTPHCHRKRAEIAPSWRLSGQTLVC